MIGLFSNKPELIDDGNPYDFNEWSESEIFDSSVSYLASIDKVEDGELTIFGKFHSDLYAISCRNSHDHQIGSWPN